jgi:hypothetical protein
VPGARNDVLKVTAVDGVDSNKQALTGVGDGSDGQSDHADFCMVRLDEKDLKNLDAAKNNIDGGTFGKTDTPEIKFTL